MANITADKAVGHNLYAKINNVVALEPNLKTVRKVFLKGELIGNIYSYIVRDGRVYWMLYLTAYDMANQKPVYVLHDNTKLLLPDIPEILANIETEERKKQIEEKGIVPYYIEKYAPYIVGAIVVSFALPSIVKTKKNIGMKSSNSQKIIVGSVIALGILYWYKTKRKKGQTPVISEAQNIVEPTIEQVSVISESTMVDIPTNSKLMDSSALSYVGPFQVEYSSINGVKKQKTGLNGVKLN